MVHHVKEPPKPDFDDEPRSKFLPPIQDVSYTWVYVVIFVLILAGLLIGKK